MKRIAPKLWLIAALGGSLAAFAADPPTPHAVPGSATKDCRTATGAAHKECLKVAAQMDQSAQGKRPPAGPPGDASGKKGQNDTNPATAVSAVHHSSPIMTTPEEKAAADATRKGKDPKKAVDKLHAKEGEQGPK